MKQFWKILKFELKNYLNNKTFVGITVFLVALIAVVMFFPQVKQLFDKGDRVPSDNRPLMLVISDTKENSSAIKNAFSAAFSDYEVQMSDADEQSLKDKIVSGEAKCAFVINGLTSYTYYVNNLSMYDANTVIADEVLGDIYRTVAMIRGGLSEENASAILNTRITGNTENLGKDQFQNFFTPT